MRDWRPYRVVVPILVVAIATVFGLLPAGSAEAATATKSCFASGVNVYTCSFTVLPGVTTSGSWLVQTVTPGSGTISGTPSVTTASGCTAVVASGGTLISGVYGNSDYDVAVSGCGAGASVTITETIAVTSTGQVCQRVWVHTASPFALACGNVTYTPPPPPPATATATKSCAPTSTLNEFICSFTVTPAFPAVAGDIIHVNEPPGPGMTGPGTFTSMPVVTVNTGGGAAPAPVVLSTSTSYHATVGAGGCAGTSWTVTFTELVAVTATGTLCQSFYMVATVPPATACGQVTYTPPATITGSGAVKTCQAGMVPNRYDCTFAVTLAVPANAGDLWLIAMTGPGTLNAAPAVASNPGCSVTPVVSTAGVLINNTTTSTYEATVGAGGCTAGAVVTFNETINVTADGQICQTVWVNAGIPGVTACATVAFAKSLTPMPPGTPGAGKGTFASTPNFGMGMSALAIFQGGSVDQLEAATAAAGGSGVWVQDSSGTFRLLIASGPAFLKDAFSSMFPGGFSGVVSVTVTRAG